MDIHKVFKQLLSAGYNKQDIMDLTGIFQTQLADLEINQDSEELSQQLHKLKGGLRLLCLNEHVITLESIEASLNENSYPQTKSSLESFLTSLREDLDNLRNYH